LARGIISKSLPLDEKISIDGKIGTTIFSDIPKISKILTIRENFDKNLGKWVEVIPT